MTRGLYSKRMLFLTILAGLLYAAAGEFFYQKMVDIIPGVLLILIYFTGLFLILGAVVYLIGKGAYSQAFSGINKKQWLVTLLLILLLSAFFEFLYEIVREKDQTKQITGYLFVLDDSGSMETNDPERIRYQAVDTLLEDKPDDFNYGIYSFNDSSTVLRDMLPKSQGQDVAVPYATGGTAIKGTLADIRDAIKKGELSIDAGCRIILLSDGYATDVSFFNKNAVANILNDFAGQGIRISTVGLENADESLMRLIADKTGGVYVHAEDVSRLEEAMNQAAVEDNESRNLLGYRSGASMNLLLGVMRILFIVALGMVIAVEKAVLCERFLDTKSVLISSAAGSILAGLCIEIGMNMFGIHPVIMRMVTCVLIAFTLLKKDMGLMGGENSGVKYASGR